MLVSKNRDTNSLLISEKKSLGRFLAFYTLLVFLLIAVSSLFFYQSQEKLMFSNNRTILSNYANEHIKRIKTLHHYFDERRVYPRDSRFRSAIYDLEEVKIFSLLRDGRVRLDSEIYQTGDKIHYVKILDNYYLGAKYLIIEIDADTKWQRESFETIGFYGFIAFVLLELFGLYLAKLFLGPMRDSIILLDRFIKDTTHELNTPLSTILANVERMDTSVMIESNKKKLERINIAAKTVSILYEDLKYLTLESERLSQNEPIDLKTVIEERIEYFDTMAKSKKIKIVHDLQSVIFVMDRKKCTRVIDNLISNAIKYNKRGGTVALYLREGILSVKDSGIGISEENIPYIFDRYMRFNNSEGGFGVGLSIVKKIIDEYKVDIKVESTLMQGTRITLQWKKD